MPDLRPGRTTGKPSEDTAPSDALVLFGAMGNLATKKIFSGPYGSTWSSGCSRDWRRQSRAHERTSQRARPRQRPAARGEDSDQEALAKLLKLLRDVGGDYQEPATF